MALPLIIFDIDGTLTDSIKMHQDLYAGVLEKMELEKEQEFGTYKHHTDRYIFREIYHRNHNKYPSQETIIEFYSTACRDYAHWARENAILEIKGAAAFISEQLKANQIPYVFATGSISALALAKLSIFNLPAAELLLAASDDIDSREEIVMHALQKAQQFYEQDSFDDPIIIGDGLWDYLTAQNLGMRFMGIGSSPVLAEALGNKTALWKDFTGRTLQDLLSQAISTK